MTEVPPRTPPSVSDGPNRRSAHQDRRVRDAGGRDLRSLIPMASVLIIGAILYLARGVLVPLALSVLLAFLLAPVVGLLERLRLGRVLAVMVVVVAVFLVLAAMGWALAVQFTALGNDLPRYRQNLRLKIADIRGAGKGGALEQVQTTVKEVTEELQEESRGPAGDKAAPVPVVVKSEPTGLWQFPPLLEGLASAAAVFVLVIFMLLERQELRNRLIRLVGYGRLTTTTRALDEAGGRISRYLLMQTLINGSFGLGIGVGLFFIGVPYAALWGFLASVLRFIPYVGPWLAAGIVIVLSLAIFPGWTQPLLVVGLFVILELVSNLVMEPLLYGQSAGVSQLALLVAVTFWTWLWGPIGLMLATPLTVCLVVLGRHVPELQFIAVLLTDEPAMDPDIAYYQRLLAMDPDEASDIVDGHLKTFALETVYDDVVLAALNHARRDRQRGRLSSEQEDFIWRSTREILDSVAVEHPSTAVPVAASDASAADSSRALRTVKILGCPARDEADALAILMLQHLLDPGRWDVHVASPHLLVSEVLTLVEEQRPEVVCIGALPFGGMATHTRHLCKRLRARFPALKIVVGRWGLRESVEEGKALIRAAGADHVGTTLVETRDQIQQISHLDPTPATAPPSGQILAAASSS